MAIYLARELPQADWGTYSLGYALMLFAQGFQRALVCIPIATMAHQDDVLSRSIGFWRKLQWKVTVFTLSAVLLSAVISRGVSRNSSISESLLIAALLVPGFFSLEFWRRLLIQSKNIRVAAINAAVFLLLVIILLPLLSVTHSGALVAAAGISFCAFMAGSITRSRALSLIPAAGEPLDLGQQVWQFGRWASLSHLAYSGYNTVIQVALSIIAGPAAMGSFAAVRNLVQPVNTLIGAIDNVDKPRAARAYAADGFRGLFSSLWRTVATLSLFGGAYVLICAAGGGYVINLLYHHRYGYAWGELWMWCVIAMAMMAAQPLESGLYVANRTDALFSNRLFSTVIGLGTAIVFIPALGVLGALLGLFSGYLTTGLLATYQLYRLSKEAVSVRKVSL